MVGAACLSPRREELVRLEVNLRLPGLTDLMADRMIIRQTDDVRGEWDSILCREVGGPTGLV